MGWHGILLSLSRLENLILVVCQLLCNSRMDQEEKDNSSWAFDT